MSRSSASSDVLVTCVTMVIVLRVLVSQCSHSRGVCGRGSAVGSVALQIGQRPFWAASSRPLVATPDAHETARMIGDERVRCWSGMDDDVGSWVVR
jgi:hypothetical protein